MIRCFLSCNLGYFFVYLLLSQLAVRCEIKSQFDIQGTQWLKQWMVKSFSFY